MSQQSIDPQVVLTADNSQYDQSMQTSAGLTTALANSVDSLGQKLNSLAKSAGRSLVKIAAADVATITAATAAYGAYEKQVSRLQAQAAVLNRNMDVQKRTFASYERSVSGLRKEFGTSTAEATALTLQLSKMSDQTKPLTSLSKTFVEMSDATGEASTGLASSLLNLQRVMGTPQRDTRAYADQMTTLAASTNTSATALTDFASQLAPIGRMVGMSQTDIAGVATAFTKAGQDGSQAAMAFSKIMSDVAYATQSGSPDLAKYANLIGVTVSHFKDMSGTEKAVSIFDSLNKLGPRAITELNRLGLDGMRTMRAITAMSQQTGGLGTSIQQAQQSFGNESTSRGAQAATATMSDEFKKLRSEVTMTAEAFGESFAPAVTKALKVIETMASTFRAIMDGPFGDFIKVVATVAAPLAAMAGGLLLVAGAITKIAGAALLIRSSGTMGFMAGLRGGGQIAAGAPLVAGGRPASWFQRGMYNSAAAVGGATGGMYTGLRTPTSVAGFGQGGMMAMMTAQQAGGGVGILNRMGTMAARGAAFGANAMSSFLSPMTVAGFRDPASRMRLFTAPTMMGSFGRTPVPAFGAGGMMATAQAAQAANAAASAGIAARSANSLSTAMRSATSATTRLAGTFLSAAANVGVMAGRLGGAAGGALGGAAIGIGKSMMTSPMAWMMGAAIAVPAGMMAYDKFFKDKSTAEFTNLAGGGTPYMKGAGLTPPSTYTAAVTGAPQGTMSLFAAKSIDQSDIIAATRTEHHLADKGMYGMDAAQATSYLAANWTSYRNNTTARQNVTLDLIDKFGAGSAARIMRNLDANASLGTKAFVGPGIDFDKMGKDEAGDAISGALGVIQSSSDVAAGKGGAGPAARARAGGLAEMLTGLQASVGGTVNAEDKAAFDILNEQLLGGAFEGGYSDLLQGVTGVSHNLHTGQATTRYGATTYAQGLQGADTQSVKGQAALIASLAQTIATSGKEGAEKSATALLSQFGVNTEGLNMKDLNDVNKALLKELQKPAVSTSYEMRNRIAEIGPAGKSFAKSTLLSQAEIHTEDVGLYYNTINTLSNQVSKNGKSLLENYKDLGNIQGEIGDSTRRNYQIAEEIRGRMMQGAQMRMSLMGRPQAYGYQAQIYSAQMDKNQLTGAQKEQATQTFMQQTLDQAQFFKQAIMQQRQFDLQREQAEENFATTRGRMEEQYNLSRARAQESFNISRKQQEEDYQLSRQRAQRDYDKQVERSQLNYDKQVKRAGESYERSMNRAHADFNRSRRQQDRDYQHQAELMVKSSAMSMYNVYQREQVQRTHSAGFLFINMKDQLKRLQEQEANLQQLRGMGLKDESIQQLGLGKAENSQQLTRLTAEMTANPEMIQQMNAAVSARMEAAGELVTDESSQEWQEFTRQHKIATDRASAEFERTVARSHKDFNTTMSQMEEDFQTQMTQMDQDFKTSMNDQAQSYEIAQRRQQRAFSRSMDQAAEDYATSVAQMVADFNTSMTQAQENLDLMATNISGNLFQIMQTASTELRGKIGEQADLVFAQFTNLDDSLGKAGVKIMIRLSDVFHFPYTPPKGWRSWGKEPDPVSSGPSAGHGPGDSDFDVPHGAAEGGVMPGYTPGRDVHSIRVSGGEAIMRPEWARAVGEETINTMNHRAKYGGINQEQGYAEAGVVRNNPDQKVYMDGETVSAISKAQLLLAEKLSKTNLSVMQGSWQPYSSYSGSSHMGPGVVDTSPGSFREQYWLRRVGFAAWARNIPGAAQAGSGAHVHSVSRIDPGASGHAQLSSFARGEDGLGGPDYGPDPEVLPNLLAQLSQFGDLAITSGGGTGAGAPRVVKLSSVLKDVYPEVEKASAAVKLMGGVFPEKWWSRHLNKDAKQALQEHHIKWNRDGGIYDDPNIIGVGEKGPEMVLPLNENGADFLTQLMRRVSVGTEGRAGNVRGSTPVTAHTINAYQIDRSTTFSGAITVQANNPNELIQQLRTRQRTQAMANPSLAAGGGRL